MVGAKWLRSLSAGLVLTGLAAIGAPALAATVHPGNGGIAEGHGGDPWGPGVGGGGGPSFHVAFHTFDTFNAFSNGSIFRSENFFSDGRGREHVWSFSGQHVVSYDTIRELLREGGCIEQPPVEVSGVPIPSAVWLFLSAIALLFGISFCRNTAKG
jgi:hypothetical protein